MRKFLVFLAVMLAFSESAAPTTLKANSRASSIKAQKTQVIERLKASAPVPILADNATGTPLEVAEATVREVSKADLRVLTGNSSHATTFPEVSLLNTSTKTIASFAIGVRNLADDRSGTGIVYQHAISIPPGGTYQVLQEQWLKAERSMIKQGGVFLTRFERPGPDSSKFWILGKAADLRVSVAIVNFADGSRWIRPRG